MGTLNDVLASCWEQWAARLDTLDGDDSTRPTRCVGWNVHELAAHAAPDVSLLQTLPNLATKPGADTIGDAAVLLRALNEPGGAAHVMADANASTAQGAAATTSLAELADRFRAGAAFVRGSSLSDSSAVPHPLGGTVTVGTIRDITLMEATVHLLDLIAAVGGVAVPDEAITAVRDLLTRVADPVALIEAATGRRPCGDVLPFVR
jgi:uncharacterized protein (TIGR03083 family)